MSWQTLKIKFIDGEEEVLVFAEDIHVREGVLHARYTGQLPSTAHRWPLANIRKYTVENE